MSSYIRIHAKHSHFSARRRTATLTRKLSVEQLEDRTLLSGIGDFPDGTVQSIAFSAATESPVISIGTSNVIESDAGRSFLKVFASDNGSGDLDEPGGLTFGPDNNGDGTPDHLYLASFFGEKILRYDSQDGDQEAFVASGLDNPADIKFGPDGNLYVVNAGTNEILRFDGITGIPLPSAGNNGAIYSTLVGGGGARGLDFDESGDLYVSISSEVQRFQGPMSTTPGAFIDIFVSSESSALNSAKFLTFGPDGNLYVVSGNTDEVLRYNGATGSFIDAFVNAGSGGIDNPLGLSFADGILYVTSRATSDSVLMYDDTTGSFIATAVPSGSGGLDDPTGVAVGPDRTLYVANGGTDEILHFGSAAYATFTVTRQGDSDGQVSVNYTTTNITALAGSDFHSSSGQLTFASGETEKTINVLILGDDIPEADETFSVFLFGAIGATISNSQGLGTILDDDSTGQPQISVSDNSALADDAHITFTTPLSQFRSGVADSSYVRPGYADAVHYIDVTNSGDAPLKLAEIQIAAPDVSLDISLTADSADDITLAAGQTQRFQLTYAPTLPSLTNPNSHDFNIAVGLTIISDASNATSLPIMLTGKSTFASDVSYDGSVNFGDLGIFNSNFGLNSNSANWDPTADINGDGGIDFGDLGLFNAQFGSILDSENTFTAEVTGTKSVTRTATSTDSDGDSTNYVTAIIENEDTLLAEADNTLASEAAKLIAPDEDIIPALYEEPPTTNENEAVFEQLGGGSREESLADLFEFNSPLTDDLAMV